MVRHFLLAVVGHIADHDALFRRRRQIHRVGSDAHANQKPAPLEVFQILPAHGREEHHEGVAVASLPADLLRRASLERMSSASSPSRMIFSSMVVSGQVLSVMKILNFAMVNLSFRKCRDVLCRVGKPRALPGRAAPGRLVSANLMFCRGRAEPGRLVSCRAAGQFP